MILENFHDHTFLQATPLGGNCSHYTRNLNTIGITGFSVAGVKWWHSTTKGKVDMVTVVASRVTPAIR